ncbi:hypothetical protein GOP47_0006254 [Adiantum capillus-veneris]|nr:hypothetical protein GOP47_0006254 [Adiantum capillus-veneris]
MLSRASVSSFSSTCHSSEIACSFASMHVSFLPRSSSGSANGARQCDRTGSAPPVEMHSSRNGMGFWNVRNLEGKVKSMSRSVKVELPQSWFSDALLSASLNFPVVLCFSGSAHAEVFDQQINHIYGDIGAGLDIGVQILYLAALLGLVGVASYFVVKQVLIRRDLESAARDLQDRVRSGEALPVEYFELGAVMLRKKFYVLATRYLEQAIAKWDGDPQDLAQVHNALGYSYVNDDNIDRGIAEYRKALKLQPGYVVAWNNLGSAYEKKKNLPKALEAYEQALLFDPNNAVAKEYRDALKLRVERLKGVPMKYD